MLERVTAPVPIRLEAALLRGTLPDLVLREGMLLAARVAQRGVLSLAGRQVAAELPETLAPGQEVQLRVEEATPERVVLRVVEQPLAPPVPPPLLPLPGGLEARIAVRADEEPAEREGAGENGRRAVVVTYESPALGSMELRLALDAAALRAVVETAAPAAAQAAAAELRDALAQAAGRPAEVTVVERREPVDVYA